MISSPDITEVAGLGASPTDVTRPESATLYPVQGRGQDLVRLWDLTANDPCAKPRVLQEDLPGRGLAVPLVAISSDSRWLVTTGSCDGTARLWDLTANDLSATPLVLRAHGGPVNSVAIGPDSRRLVHRLAYNGDVAGGQLAVFQGASEAPISESYGSSEQRGKTANRPRPGGLR